MYAQRIAVLTFAILPICVRAEQWKREVDNTLVRVVRCYVGAHETASVSDSSSSLFVFLADYPVRIGTPERQPATHGRRGDFFWYSGGAVTFTNPGEQRVAIVRVISKFGADPSYQLGSLANPSVIEFENELMRMRRIGPPSPTTNGVGRPHDRSSSVMIELT